MNRKEFLRNTALVSASFMLPRFLRGADFDLAERTAEGKVVVVIQFSGGNDGLNTVVPYRNDLYHRARPSLGLDKSEVLRLDDDLALNPNLVGLAELYDDGALTIFNSVGYPNPNRSHFRSMDIWQSGSGSERVWSTGWIGRYLDAKCPDGLPPYAAMEVDDTLSLALKGKEMNGLAVQKPTDFYRNTQEPFFHAVSQQTTMPVASHPQLDYLHKTLAETTISAEYVYAKSKIYQSTQSYPGTLLGRKLKLIAELIVANSATKLYYVSLPGFDTHINQKGPQGRLLLQYGNAIRAFTQDLKANDRFEDVVIVTFSEFGRRVQQNGSGGTDHGTANNLFLISGALRKPGIFNAPPDLSDLDEGDLKYQLDFRNIYATLLERWLKADANGILQGDFSALPVI
ncbi:MAG: DUF1501 domain-containing protein [Bacteroidota bacterium]